MKYFKLIVFLLGCATFFIEPSWGFGWLFGSIAMFLLNRFREPILDKVIDFNQFKMSYYMLYLLGVILWVALPLLVAFKFPEYLNPLAVFAAYFISRILMFITNARREKGGS